MSKEAYDRLLELDTFGSGQQKKLSVFMDAMHESYRHHFANCVEYRKFCSRRGYTLETVFHSPAEIPFLPVQAFKEFGEYLISSTHGDKQNLLLQSSATSGRPSSVSIDKTTARRQVQTMSKSLMHFAGTKRRPFLVFDVDPKEASAAVIGARRAATMGFLNFAKDPIYLLSQTDDGKLTLKGDLFRSAIDTVNKGDIAPIIFGFTYVLYEAVLEQFRPGDLPLLDSDALLIHIGGWKKLESRKISKSDFNKKVEELLGISCDSVLDVYGFTEQMGIIYPSGGETDKTAPVFSEVLVRDPATLEVLPDGEEGVLQFLSPMPLSYPGISVLTDDLGVITGYNEDPVLGACGTTFKVTGRSKNAEVRGCGDIMSSYVVTNPLGDVSEHAQGSAMLMFNGKSVVSDSALLSDVASKLPSAPEFLDLRRELLQARSKLDSYSVDELIDIFQKCQSFG